MREELTFLVGLRKEEAVEILTEKGFEVWVKETKPPRPRIKGEPIAWRVIKQKTSDKIVELTVTPEWIDWLTLPSSKSSEP